MASAEGLEPSRTRKNSNKNIIARIRHGHITGRGICRGTEISEALLKERDHKAQWHGIPVLLRRLYDKSHLNSDLSQIYFIIKEVSSFLSMEAMSFVTEDRKPAQESTYPNTYTFDLFGGVDLLVEILMRPTLTTQTNVPKMSDDLVKDCLSVLYNCCICMEGVTKSLASRDDFVMFLFTLMSNKKTFLQTATLIEDILGVRKEMIQLEDIPNLPSLVQSFNQQQLANFCRILSVTISEPDMGNDDKNTLLAKNAQQRANPCPSYSEINQVALLNIPGFIERLCKLATRKVSEASGASSLLLELQDWYTWLDNAPVLDALMQMAAEDAEHSSTEVCIWLGAFRLWSLILFSIPQEISFKIQFLRLLQSFSDHHENLICDGKKGLLTRLISVMKKEPPDSSFRFWQARAVESFLRGTTSYADQVFLLKRGLLEHILFCIIDSGCKSRDVLQSYFDLLGELMKFNMDAFKKFNRYVNSDEKFQTFMTQINSSLVDSNMLVRCIILSLDRFEGQTEDMRVVEVLSECRLLSYMARVENRLTFLFRLVNIINVQTLTQENVSCLNTSLVVLMLARRRGTLPFYLNALREKEYAEKYPGCLLNNFHNLLRFWQRHYLNKDKDSTCLENVSVLPDASLL
uniref:Transient receptor potential cation channel, subfamily C, member 4 associated protein a n=1 Tax=Esox lucius TaxID=8010 RepID=A0A3P8Y599_ESOLU